MKGQRHGTPLPKYFHCLPKALETRAELGVLEIPLDLQDVGGENVLSRNMSAFHRFSSCWISHGMGK